MTTKVSSAFNKRNALTLILILLSALYLTFLVNLHTLETTMQRVFIFCYFVVMGMLACFLKGKYAEGKPFTSKSRIAAAVLAALLVSAGWNTFLPKTSEITFTLSSAAREDGSHGEVWLVDVVTDGNAVSLSSLSVDATQGWEYNNSYDDYIFYPSAENNSGNCLTLTATASDLTLKFAKNPWSGSVSILSADNENAILDLTAAEDGIAEYSLSATRSYALWEKVLYTLGAWAVVSYFAQLALLFLARPMEKRGWTERQKVLAFLLMGNFVFLFFTSDRIQPTHLTQGFLLLLTVASVWCFNRKSGCMEKYRAKGSRAAIGVIAVYASLASFAQRFFLNGNTRMHFSLPGLFYVLSGILWFIPVVWLMLFALEWLSARPRTLPKPGSRKKALCVLLIALLLCQVFVLWVEWPGGLPADSVDQLHQALGDYGMSDSHPFLHTLLERAILTVIPHPGAITAVQLLLFSLVLCAFLMMGYDRGMPVPLLVFLGCFFELMPNQALSWTNVLKDFPFTLALLWGTYLLLQLALDMPRSRKWPFYACLTLDIFLVSLLRHNGAAPAAAMIVLCIVLTVRRYEQVKLRALTAAVLAAVSFGVFKGPVMTALNVAPTVLSPYTTLFCAVGSCVNKDLPLSEEADAILEKALPLEDWRDYYARYYGHDYYYYQRPAGSVPYTPTEVTTAEILRVYGEALCKYPDVILKDRIDGCDVLWDVVQPEDGYTAKSFCFIYSFDELGQYVNIEDYRDDSGNILPYKQDFFTKAYLRLTGTARNSVLDILLWRTGAYLIAFWVLLLFWRKNGMQRFRSAAVPLIGNLIISVLYVYHQSFRYVYFVQVCVLALLFATVVCRPRPPQPEE